jgi:hypothetical protein
MIALGERPSGDPSSEETPQQIVHRYLEGMVRGDADQIRSCFDTDTTNGSVAAEAFAAIAEFFQATARAQNSAAKKFGPDAERVVQERFGVSGNISRAATDDLTDRLKRGIESSVEVYFNARGDRAIAHVADAQEEHWKLAKRDGQWHLVVTDDEAKGLAIACAMRKASLGALERLPTILAESETLEEFRSRLQRPDLATPLVVHQYGDITVEEPALVRPY